MRSKEPDYGTFCEVYGKTLRNLVLENILERGDLDFAVSDILNEIAISKPKLYQIVEDLFKNKIIIKSRSVAGTQLYLLNKKNRKVSLLSESFRRCLKMVFENAKSPQHTTHIQNVHKVITA